MIYLFYFFVSAVLISFQTTVTPSLPFLLTPFNLLIPFVVYITLFRSLFEGLPVIIIAGCALDMLSGAPAGIYVIIFVWILLLFKRAKIYFHLKDPALFKMILIIGILIENIIFGLFHSINNADFHVSLFACQIVLIQLLWAIITSPVIYMVLYFGFEILDTRIVSGMRKRF